MLDDPVALGVVPDEGRGSLPYSLIFGEPLMAVATFALEGADITVLDPRTDWDQVVACELPLVIHDPLCPLTPPSFLVEAVSAAASMGEVVVGVRPVSDTIKEDLGDRLGATIDRSMLREVTSPIVVPAGVVASLEEMPTGDFLAILGQLPAAREVEAPALSRRVRTVADLRLLEALGHG